MYLNALACPASLERIWFTSLKKFSTNSKRSGMDKQKSIPEERLEEKKTSTACISMRSVPTCCSCEAFCDET